MVTQHGIKLAVHLISSYFGVNVAKVCECLLHRGTLPLAQIIQFTALGEETVRCSLLVLIQHNCVQAFAIRREGGFGKASRIITHYMVLFDNIIHHMRFPKFLVVVSEDLGEECEKIILRLLLHGRLSLKQISDRHKDTSNQSEGNCMAQNAVNDFFNKLVNARYVERCPTHEPFLAPPDEEETSVKKKGAKSSKACIETVRTLFDDGADIVLSAMLEANRSKETKVKMENSVPLSMDAIYEEVIKSDNGCSMTLEHVRASLVQLGCHLPTIGIDETYSIDLKNIIQLAQNEEVESIVDKRYGREAYKMFRLLSMKDCLIETDEISATALVPKKDTAKTLFKLWKDDYLHMEKVVTNGARESQFMLWKVNKNSLWEHVLDEMYHAALNLRLRTAYEQEKEKEVIHIPVGELRNKYKRVEKVGIALESSLIKLDDAIMLFHDF